MALRPCLGDAITGDPCGIPSQGTRCPQHQRARDRAHHNRAYDSLAWRRFRDRTLAVHRARYGNRCPGAPGHPPHDIEPPEILTVDHVIRLVDGGALLDRANTRVLCRTWNGVLGARS